MFAGILFATSIELLPNGLALDSVNLNIAFAPGGLLAGFSLMLFGGATLKSSGNPLLLFPAIIIALMVLCVPTIDIYKKTKNGGKIVRHHYELSASHRKLFRLNCLTVQNIAVSIGLLATKLMDFRRSERRMSKDMLTMMKLTNYATNQMKAQIKN